MDTSIFQYKSCLLHACFLPVLSVSPIPFPMPLPRRLPLGAPIVTHVNNAEGEALYAYAIYLVVYNILVCIYVRWLYYVFFVFWETYALLTKYFNLTAFCMQCGRLGSTRLDLARTYGPLDPCRVAVWLEGL